MYLLMTKRIYKLPTGTQERFSPRHANEIRWEVSGPFSAPAAAEAAAVQALGSLTCVSVVVIAAADAGEWAKYYGGSDLWKRVAAVAELAGIPNPDRQNPES